MAYPTLPLLDSSAPDLVSGIEVSRATNLRLRMRRLAPAAKATFSLKHFLSVDQVSQLQAHYAANKDLSFAFTWPEDGVERSCAYGKELPIPRQSEVPGYFLVDVLLLEV